MQQWETTIANMATRDEDIAAGADAQLREQMANETDIAERCNFLGEKKNNEEVGRS